MFDLPVSSLQVLSDAYVTNSFVQSFDNSTQLTPHWTNRIFREPLFFGTAVELKHSHQLHNLHVFT